MSGPHGTTGCSPTQWDLEKFTLRWKICCCVCFGRACSTSKIPYLVKMSKHFCEKPYPYRFPPNGHRRRLPRLQLPIRYSVLADFHCTHNVVRAKEQTGFSLVSEAFFPVSLPIVFINFVTEFEQHSCHPELAESFWSQQKFESGSESCCLAMG